MPKLFFTGTYLKALNTEHGSQCHGWTRLRTKATNGGEPLVPHLYFRRQQRATTAQNFTSM